MNKISIEQAKNYYKDWDIIAVEKLSNHESCTEWFIKVKALIYIKNVELGEIRKIKDDYLCIFELGDDPSLYWWEDGNGSCDCNRGREFYRSNGIEADPKCGHESFLIKIINPKTSEVVYNEFEGSENDAENV